MAPLESSEKKVDGALLAPPRRKITLELMVGLFAFIGVAAAGALAVGLGGARLFSSLDKEIVADFDNVAGLENGASVEIAGVRIGEVTSIALEKNRARVSMRINPEVRIFDEDRPAIRTKGIIGNRYIKIIRGSSLTEVAPGTVFFDTEAVVDIEELIGKFMNNMSTSSSTK